VQKKKVFECTPCIFEDTTLFGGMGDLANHPKENLMSHIKNIVEKTKKCLVGNQKFFAKKIKEIVPPFKK
jgi:hypothetical protein